MKQILLFATSFCFCFVTFSQSSKTAYLSLMVDGMDGYYKINADTGSLYAKEIYNLIEYKKKGTNGEAIYYSKDKNDAKPYYNYFSTKTEALQFLADNNWQLVTVSNEVYSDYTYERFDGKLLPVTRVLSRPIYYFKKGIE